MMAEPVWEAVGANASGETGTSVTVPNPGGVVAGKLVVVYMYLDGAPQTVTMPDETWDYAPASPESLDIGGGSHGIHAMWHRATGDETDDYVFSWASSVFRTARACRYGDVVAAGVPWDEPGDGAQDATSGSASPAVSMTSLGPDRLDCWAATNWSGGTWTPPSGFTERFEGNFGVFAGADRSHPDEGSTGSVSGTCTGNDKRTAWIGTLIGTTVAGGEVALDGVCSTVEEQAGSLAVGRILAGASGSAVELIGHLSVSRALAGDLQTASGQFGALAVARSLQGNCSEVAHQAGNLNTGGLGLVFPLTRGTSRVRHAYSTGKARTKSRYTSG